MPVGQIDRHAVGADLDLSRRVPPTEWIGGHSGGARLHVARARLHGGRSFGCEDRHGRMGVGIGFTAGGVDDLHPVVVLGTTRQVRHVEGLGGRLYVLRESRNGVVVRHVVVQAVGSAVLEGEVQRRGRIGRGTTGNAQLPARAADSVDRLGLREVGQAHNADQGDRERGGDGGGAFHALPLWKDDRMPGYCGSQDGSGGHAQELIGGELV